MKWSSAAVMLVLSTAGVLVGCTSLPASGGGVSATATATATSSPQTTACKPTSEAEIAALFDRWNQSLQTGVPHKVVEHYAPRSVLLPTVSNKPRLTAQEKADYFHHFLENKPVGVIDSRTIELGCNMAVDSGLYTFTFQKTGAKVGARYSYVYRWTGTQWLISSHHSSALPEKS